MKINKLLPKFIWRHRGPRIPKASLKNKIGKLTLPDKATVITRV